MTWTYVLPPTTPKDQVRLLVQDTDAQDPLLQDEEITTFLTWYPNVYRAASRCADTIARQFARQAKLNIAREVDFDPAERNKQYAAMARTLEDEANKGAGGGGVGVCAGGIGATASAPAFCRGLLGTQASPSCRQCGQPQCGCGEVEA